DDVARAREAGARWIVTPALTESVAASVRVGLPVLAGALTPTEAVAARRAGADAVKLFPASIGGPAYLKALRDPFPDLPLVPVGGVDPTSAEQYLAHGAVAVGVGSPLVGDAAHGGDLDALRERARRFVELCAADTARGQA
ncbi:aldolase, partial [Streptomyces sp. SID5926]|nr:aldolase [Streptomyces sp. SID5926]